MEETKAGRGRKRRLLKALLICLSVIAVIWGINALLTGFIVQSNIVCKGLSFSSPEEAIRAMEAEAREANDLSLDYCPPYELQDSFELDDHVIVIYSFSPVFDGTPSADYQIEILRRSKDGSLSFTGGSADLRLYERGMWTGYYFFTNIKTAKGLRSISFFLLPRDTEQTLFVDGKPAETRPILLNGEEYRLATVLSKPDSFFTNLVTPIQSRHFVELH